VSVTFGILGSVLETSARLLRLLSLLQSRHMWSGDELAERLRVDVRTVRRDMDRLRTLGYVIHSASGTGGGYRLEAGARMPPLLPDDDEAVAVAIGLRLAGMGGVAGIDDSSARALGKLDQVLPGRLRSRIGALLAATVAVPPDRSWPVVDPATLTTIAEACRDLIRLRFDYRSHDGAISNRLAEPHRLVTWGRRWYLVAWDVHVCDWRTFRVDRIEDPVTGAEFTPRRLPTDNAATYVARGVSAAAWRYHATVTVNAPAEVVAERITAAVGAVKPVDDHTCVLETGADTLDTLALYLGLLGADFHVTDPPELTEHIRSLAARYTRATP
jgi:predicted DNA-binding transcriptional regulator YafY